MVHIGSHYASVGWSIEEIHSCESKEREAQVEEGLYPILRIWARSTDPEAWNIEYLTSLRGEG